MHSVAVSASDKRQDLAQPNLQTRRGRRDAPEHADVGGGAPRRVSDDGVHPGGHEAVVQDVGLEARALSDGARDDGARRGTKLPAHRTA